MGQMSLLGLSLSALFLSFPSTAQESIQSSEIIKFSSQSEEKSHPNLAANHQRLMLKMLIIEAPKGWLANLESSTHTSRAQQFAAAESRGEIKIQLLRVPDLNEGEIIEFHPYILPFALESQLSVLPTLVENSKISLELQFSDASDKFTQDFDLSPSQWVFSPELSVTPEDPQVAQRFERDGLNYIIALRVVEKPTLE